MHGALCKCIGSCKVERIHVEWVLCASGCGFKSNTSDHFNLNLTIITITITITMTMALAITTTITTITTID